MRLTGLLTLAFCASSLAAHAASIVDQQNPVANTGLIGATSAGQSFTPSLNAIDFATFNIVSYASSGSSSVTLNLFSGGGFSGALLGTSGALSVTTQRDYTFFFSSPLALVAGNLYTLQLKVASGSYINVTDANGNAYTRGMEYSSGGFAYTDFDMTFSEGLTTSATPEPSSFALLATGVLGLFGVMRKRHV